MIAVAFATHKECRAALPELKQLPKQGDWENTFLQGLPASVPVSVLITGVGPVNAALTLGRYLGHNKEVVGIINAGIAGSFDLQALPLCHTCVVTTETTPEYGLVTDHETQRTDPEKLGFPQWQETTPPIYATLPIHPEKALRTIQHKLQKNQTASRSCPGFPAHWPCVESLTVMGVTGTQKRAILLRQQYKAQLENMEGFALALGALQADIPFIAIRSVSNLVGSREARHWDIQGALYCLSPALRTLLSLLC